MNKKYIRISNKVKLVGWHMYSLIFKLLNKGKGNIFVRNARNINVIIFYG